VPLWVLNRSLAAGVAIMGRGFADYLIQGRVLVLGMVRGAPLMWMQALPFCDVQTHSGSA
jgi:hypothetical protein